MNFKAFTNNGLSVLCRPVMILLALVIMAGNAFALEPTDKWEGSIDYAATGGTFLEDTCQATSFGCFPGETDRQGDVVTSVSSASMVGIPDDSNVVKAYLVWMGSVEHTYGEDLPVNPPDNELTLQPPGGKKYPIVGTAADIEEITYEDKDVNDEKATFHFYTYRVDITEIMQQHTVADGKDIEGLYTVSDFSGYADEPYKSTTLALGGWSILIVYSSVSADPKRIYYYQDFSRIRDSELVLNPVGFQVPETPDAKVTFFSGEGDPGISGMGASATHNEELRFNNSLLLDTCNTEKNPFNGTVNTNSDGLCLESQYSIDLDTFNVSELLAFNDTSAEVKYSVGQDEVFSNFMIIALNTKLPDFDIPGEAEKRATPAAGTALSPGQEFYYEVHVQNCGEDIATYVKVRDNLPNEVVYIANSTVIIKPDQSEVPVSDGEGGVAPVEIGVDVADSMAPGAGNRHIVKWRVRLLTMEEGITKESVVNNIGEIISGAGDVYFTNGGVPVTHTVGAESLEGKLYFSQGPAHPAMHFVDAGDTDIVIAQISLQALQGNVSISAMRLTPPEDDSNYLMISSASLYWDKDKNGRVGDEDTALGEDVAWSGGGLYFGSMGEIGQIIEGDKVYLLLTVDIADNAEPGNLAWLEILEENVDMFGFNEGLPFETGQVRIAKEGTAMTFQLGRRNPTVFFLSPGSVETVMQLQLNAYSDVTLNGLSFATEGTVYDPSEVLYIDLYNDANGNGLYDNGEKKLGHATIGSDDGSSEFTDLGLSLGEGDEENLIFVAGFSPDTLSDKDFRLHIDSDDWIDANDAQVEGAPVYGPMFTFIQGEVIPCESDEDCAEYGSGYVCDELDGICVPSSDGDFVGGDVDADGDWEGSADGDEDEKSGGGGCSEMNDLRSIGIMLIGTLMLLFCLWRMRGRREKDSEERN